MIINCLNISELSIDSYQLFRNEVSRERRRKADSFRFMIDGYRSVCAELLLQYSLFEATNQYGEMTFSYNKYGKPTLKNVNDFFFNLSHSGDWVVLAYGASEVGVDIEKIRSGNERIVEGIFKEEEKEYIYSVAGMERNKRFTQIWTLKESYIKYLGTGFSTGMNTFSVGALNNVVIDDNRELNENLFLKSILYKPDYYLAICGEEQKVTVKEVALEELIHMVGRKNRQLYGQMDCIDKGV